MCVTSLIIRETEIEVTISPAHLSEWPSSKRLQMTNVGDDVEKMDPSCRVDGKTVWRFLKKIKPEMPCDPAISFLSVYPEKMKTLI